MKKWFSVVVALLCYSMALSLQSAAEPSELQVRFPGKQWVVVIDAPGFAIEQNTTKLDGRQYLLANNHKTGLILSVTLERSPGGADPKTCPAFLQKRVDGLRELRISDVRYSTVGNLSVAEYVIPEVKGMQIRQKNLVACSARDDIYMDIHLSKARFTPEEDPLFASVVKSVRWAESPQKAESIAPGSRDSRYYMALGSRSFMQQQYREAIVPYQKALNLEKQNPKLERDLWRVLVDNLGMSYGITGDLNNAEVTFRYGLSKDATYPMFFYNLACTYAERDDLDNTLIYLKKAFEYKANAIAGEQMPDPPSDDSFKRYLNNPKFQAVVNSPPVK